MSITPPPSSSCVEFELTGTTDISRKECAAPTAVDSAAGLTTNRTSQPPYVANKSGEAAVSPSEMRQNFFRSQTPISVPEHAAPKLASGQSAVESASELHQLPDSELTPELSELQASCSKRNAVNSTLSVVAKHASSNSPCSSLSLRKKSTSLSTVKRTLLPLVEGAKDKARKGFEMGISPSEQQDSVKEYDLSFSLPDIEVPPDSQFESSENADADIYFKIPKPPLNRSVTSETSDTEAEVEENKLLFSDVTASDTRRQKLGALKGNVSSHVAGVECDPYAFNSQSQDTDMQVIMKSLRSRNGSKSLKENTKDDKGVDGEVSPQQQLDVQQTSPRVSSKSVREQDGLSDVSPVSSSTNSVTETVNRRNLIINLTAGDVPGNSSSRPSINISQSVRSRSPCLLSTSPSKNLMISSPTCTRLPVCRLPSPLSSVASSEFVSPSCHISAEGLQELRRQVNEQLGRETGVCELRYVRTVCTVIEERFISSELVDSQGIMVPGSGKAWPVSMCNNTYACDMHVEPLKSYVPGRK